MSAVADEAAQLDDGVRPPLAPEFIETASGLVCYERTLFYLLTQLHGLDRTPLLFLDRGLGWVPAFEDEPMLARPNGLERVLARTVVTERSIHRDHLRQTLVDSLGDGRTVGCDMWFRHVDGTPYATAVLLEVLDGPAGVRFTKISDSVVEVASPLSWSEVQERLDFEDGFHTPLRVYAELAPLIALSEGDDLGAVLYVFHELFGYHFEAGVLHDANGAVRLERSSTLDRVSRLFDHIRQDASAQGVVGKVAQVQLFKHVHNRYIPALLFLEFVSASPQLTAILGPHVLAGLAAVDTDLRRALRDLQKWASFATARADDASFNRHRQAFDRVTAVGEELAVWVLHVLRLLTATALRPGQRHT